jgi:hypothetical protein
MNLPNDFNYLTYIQINNDLNHMEKEEAINHYINHGIYENRDYKYTLPEDFDTNEYRLLNFDLSSLSNEELIEHYIYHGSKENRNYKLTVPADYNYLEYLNLNSDLSNLSENEAKRHYTLHGHFEKRAYSLKNLINSGSNGDSDNIVFHITHSFGGGTDVYIRNLIKIFPRYNHIIIYIEDSKYFHINNMANIRVEYLKTILSFGKLLIVHHLLYRNTFTEKLIISYESLEVIKNIVYPKIFIAHDYFLFFPNEPNPVKDEVENLKEIYKKNINDAKEILSIFDKVVFNSNNCYYNYIKYGCNIKNFFILNSVPDINFYNKQIFPPKKEKYNIGIIGQITCKHKGKFLADKIISMINNVYETKYEFVIFGEYELLKNNVTVTGKYANDKIFSLIKEKDIDFFIFLSVFEETYSFTLSIALHTGLPIIYNNIGSYTERLINCNNSFPFYENNCKDIIYILDEIHRNSANFINEKNLPDEYPSLYNNIPELSEYLKIDDKLNFSINKIEKNLHHGVVCFMHVCITNEFGESIGLQIFNDQLNYIKKSGLYDKLDYIFVTLLGKNVLLTHDYKVKVIYYSENINEQEFPNIYRIKYFSDNIEKNVKILRIHTKGVTNKPHANEWRKYLEYFLIENNELCLKALDSYKCVGVNHQYYYDADKYRNHFSGNFWWANSSYIKTLDELEFDDDRCITEHWLIGHLEKYDYRYFLSLHHTNINFYNTHLEDSEYKLELIKSNAISTLENGYAKTRKIYGLYFICCIGNYLHIVKTQLDKLFKSGLYDETDEILCFICKAEDNCIKMLQKYNKIKIIATKENLYEKFAINNFKKYVSGDYYLYYIHSKSVTRNEIYFRDWRILCDHFTIQKWRMSVELLKYYDCIGTNLKNFPKKHYSGNFWWSKSEHLNSLRDANDEYLSSEMYIMSNMKTNYVSIHQSYVNHADTNYSEEKYKNLGDEEILSNLCILPDFNSGDKKCIQWCGATNENFEPPIIELE